MSCQPSERHSGHATRPPVSSLRRRLQTGIGVAAAVVGMLVGAGGRPWALGLGPSFSADSQPATMTETWTFDRLDQIGGHPTTVLGSPRVIDAPFGKAVEFDGVDDALLVGAHPLAGASTFTWEAIFRPDGGARAQRWFHLQEDGSDNRMLFEIRVAGDRWFLDAFAYSNGNEKALINREALHPVGEWYHVAAVYDGATYSNYVNGVQQLAFPIVLVPQNTGRASVGVRVTLVDYFKGAVHSARFTKRALTPAEFRGIPKK
jgi:hypothetical protein